MDAFRIARSVHLACAMDGAGGYVVRGGAGPHVVTVADDGTLSCDCPDANYRPGVECAHCLRVKLMRGDAEALAALAELVPMPKRARRRKAVA